MEASQNKFFKFNIVSSKKNVTFLEEHVYVIDNFKNLKLNEELLLKVNKDSRG